MARQKPKEKEVDRSRLSITAVFCIILGVLLGVVIERVHIGLMIGIGIGLLTGSMWAKSRD
ncbi:hypothetical protein GA0116948_11380 [Chitinophaga costaii]|uniref:Uncharacterized protein n=1 Tax=Chitinophaga costaii TaxID=1335309 RepID=A0A1C4FD58_9BACT|nr:hypothetical protein [Chitinophaga costaii]PUZ20673.1 hypothetical protein DCM91_18075 [Chitinophaga costaii]SCC53816.1 hypothetical protein GA0116948_11380 [Chitinophaga costaii]